MNFFYSFKAKNMQLFAAVLFFIFTLPVKIFAQTERQSSSGIPGACGSANSASPTKGDMYPYEKNTTPSPLNGNGSLGQIYNNSACGLNYVQASRLTTTRAAAPNNNGSGFPSTVTVSGIPACKIIVQAYLWFIASYQASSSTTPTVIFTNPNSSVFSFASATVGSGGSKCWGEAGTRTYRANVTTGISGNGNYTIDLSGMANKNWEVDGVTLFIIYRDPSATYQGSLIINDGIISNSTGGSASQTMTGFSACAASSSARAFMVCSDFQGNVWASHPITLNGVNVSFPTNFYEFDQINTSVTNGQSSSSFSASGGGVDCWSWGVMGLYYQTTSCITCTPSALSANTSSTNATCGNNNGTAVVTPTGGVAPYTYVWNPAVAGNVNTATGLAPGTYQVTITDATGCSSVVTITVGSTPAPTVSASGTQAGCTVSNGTAVATPSGGTPGYNYLWSPSGQTTQTATGLSAGTYLVTITDANGCTAQTSVTITSTTAPIVSATGTQAGCTVANGTATVNASGGTPGYNYLWSPSGQTTQTATGLSAGTYQVIVTDANGCSAQTSVSITSTTPPSTTSSVVNNVSCNGLSNGSATTNPSGGNPAYTYLWNPSGQITQTATGLFAGNYTVTVTDANGCSVTSVVTITQPTALTLSTIQNNVLCNGNNSGSASVIPSGGIPPYSYAWSNGQTTQTATGLSAGTYQVQVTDANGCPSQIAVTILQPLSALSSSVSSASASCNGGSNGSATVTTSGGTSPYSYLWNNGQTASTATGLSAGTYTVTITDANGCTLQSLINVTQPLPLTFFVSGNDSICAGDSTLLVANSNASGGTSPYTFVWTPGPQSGGSITVSPTNSTTYSVFITDANGCTASAQTFNVTVLPSPTALFDTASNGTLYSSSYLFSDLSSGGILWSWNFGDGSSGSTLQNPVHTFPGAGTYTVTQLVLNQYGCPDTFRIIVTINEGILIPNVFTPDGDGVNDVFFIPNSGMKEFHIEIFDRWGAKVWETTAAEIRWDGHSTSGKLLSDGTYFFALKAILKSVTGEKDYSTTGFVTLLTGKR